MDCCKIYPTKVANFNILWYETRNASTEYVLSILQ